MENLPIPYTGLSYGTGAAAKYPKGLTDGLIVSGISINDRYTDDEAESLGFPTVADPTSGRYGSKFFDFAPDGDRPIFVVFTGNTNVVTGTDNVFHTYDETEDPFDPSFDAGPPVTPVIASTWEAGRRDSQAVTGLRGEFDIWIGASLTSEVSLSGYSINDKISVSEGRIVKAGSGDVVKGRVKSIFTSGNFSKMLVTVVTNGEAVVA
jgi:hypothetical protein